jgi:hypothetical protein
MRVKQKVVSFLIISTFMLSLVSFAPIRFYAARAQSDAVLTGVIYDRGLDMDGDSKFNYLEIAAELNVFEYGYYSVQIEFLEDSLSHTFYTGAWQGGYFDVGTRLLNVSLYGPVFYHSVFSPAFVGRLVLYFGNQTDTRSHIALSHPYSYSDFDSVASFTGNMHDGVVDTDHDGLFDYLVVSVEVQVFEYGYYSVEVNSLQDSQNYTFPVTGAAQSGYFDVGMRLFNLSFYGPTINKARFNVTYLYNLRLSQKWDTVLEERFHVPLSQTYNYSDFDCRALLTGKIYDRGADTDSDGFFNFLEIGVEVNVTDASTYEVHVDGLWGTTHVSVWNYSRVELLPGIHIVNVSLYGPQIYSQRTNVSTVDQVKLQEFFDRQGLDGRNWLPLNRTYKYTEFDRLAYFTGVITDKGVDTDGDLKYDFLEVSVQINIDEAGYYQIDAHDLYEFGNSSKRIYVSDYKYGNFEAGLHLINFSFPSALIYSSKVNPAYVDRIYLSTSVFWYGWMNIDQLSAVHLSKTYQYNEFDPHAYLTGKIYDREIDTDNDGLYNYLETSVEVNVTDAGTYTVCVYGLQENASRGIYDYQSRQLSLDIGLHLFNFTFYGPQIAYYEVNPRNITSIYLYESTYWNPYAYISTTPLTRQYHYIEFNKPFNDMQVKFTAYPDGHVAVSGTDNYTHMYPENRYGPWVNASIGFSKINGMVLGTANGTVAIPPTFDVYAGYPYNYVQVPTNTTTADFSSRYNGGILNAQLNATTVISTNLKDVYPFNATDFTVSGTYSDGLVHARLNGSSIMPSFIASQMPFNITDATVLANFANNQFKGNMTVHLVSGLPMSDVKVDFEGNRSDMQFTGYINVIYGTYLGQEINATTVAQMISQITSSFPGKGEHSIYNATKGILECTKIDVVNSTISGGVRIDYNVTIHGDFAGLIAALLTPGYFSYPDRPEYQAAYAAVNATLSSVDNLSLVLVYLHTQKMALVDISFDSNLKTLWGNALQLIPPAFPPDAPQYVKDQINAMLKLGNLTAYAAKNAWLQASYSTAGPLPVFNLRTGLTANITQFKNDAFPVIPDVFYPPELGDIIGSYLNTTYAMLHSCNTTVHYENSKAEFKTDFTFEGDFKAQLNAAKTCYFGILNMTSPWQYNWQMKLFNQTDVDINNLKINLQLGRDHVLVNFEGIIALPPKQVVDNMRFKLYQFFNMTTGYGEPPRRFEKMKIIIEGGSNSTHTIIPMWSPTVPSPDAVSLDGKTMTWENTSISSLKELVFNTAFQGSYQYVGVTYYVPVLSNSTVSNFNFDLNGTLSFSVDGPLGTSGFCNITIPRSLLDVHTTNEWIITVEGNIIQHDQCNITQNAEYTFIYIPYTHSTHTIAVKGTIVVHEMPPNILPQILVLASLIAVVLIVTQRKKIRALKTKSLNIAHQMATRLFRRS